MLRVLPALIEPDVWTLAFHKTSPWWWVRLLAVGRYKHVSAFAWVAPYGMWLYYDVRLAGTQIVMLPDSAAATAWLSAQTADADLVNVRRRPTAGKFPLLAPFSCVAAIRHLTGVPRGALPSGLYRAVMAHGGERIDGRTPGDAEPVRARPGAASAEAHG